MRQSKRRKLASLDAMDVATRFVNAANQHDPDGLIACVHRDFQSVQPVHPERNFRGVGQLRSNWEAIFRSEPGFRLTVLRSTATDDTVWMELHGAGDDEEAAGTFILGIENGRIRWIRVYSDLIQPMEEPAAEVEVPTAADEAALVAVPDLTVALGESVDGGDGGGVSETDNWDAVVAERPAAPEMTLDISDDKDNSDTADEDDAADTADAPAGDGDDDVASGAEPAPTPKKSWLRLLRGKAKT
jgi:hypothetical protein